MVESRERKSAFLRECANQLSLQRSEVLTLRVQKIPPERYGTGDLVTIRALKAESDVLGVVRRLLGSTGRLMTFGGETPEGFQCDRTVEAPDGSAIRLSQPTEHFQ
jgi:16S rRNA G527 N7-methylase RsmG